MGWVSNTERRGEERGNAAFEYDEGLGRLIMRRHGPRRPRMAWLGLSFELWTCTDVTGLEDTEPRRNTPLKDVTRGSRF